jgi:hypothetical protein
MNPQTNTLDELVEAALHTYPLADVPPNFSKSVMQRVRTTDTLAASMRFHLTWMDYALGFFLTLLPAVGFALWSFLPRQVWLQIQLQLQLLRWGSIQPLMVGSLAVAGALLFLAFLFSLNFMLRPRTSTR